MPDPSTSPAGASEPFHRVPHAASLAGDWIEAFAAAAERGIALLSAEGELLEASARARELLGDLGAEGSAADELRRAAAAAAGDPKARSVEGLRIELDAAPGPEPLALELHELQLGNGSAGRTAYLVGVATRAERSGRRANLVLADRMRRLDESAQALAHDLRGPLNAIVLNVELIERIASGGGDVSERAAHARIVKKELARLNRMLDALLAETTAGRDETQSFDLRHLLSEVAERARARRRKPPLELELELPDAAVRLLAPRSALRQAVLGLVVNAIEAGAAAGPIRIELATDAGEARITVADRGQGLAPRELAGPLECAPRVRSDGSGLGLYVARSLVADLGGSLAVSRGAESGTRIELRLPLA